MIHADVRREALRLVNGARAAVGVDLLDDLPRGTRDDCGLCPVAHALEDVAVACGYAFVNVDVGWAAFHPGPASVTHWPEQVSFPEAITAFITLFDCGAFPDLEEDDA